MEKDLSVNLCSKQLTGARGRLMMSKIVVVAVACAVSSVVFAAADKASNGSAEQKAASAPTPAQKASAPTAVQKAAVPTPAQKVPAPAQKVSSPTQKEPATAQKPPEQQVSGRFTRTRLAPLTAKGRPTQGLVGRVVATFSSDQTRVKRPVHVAYVRRYMQHPRSLVRTSPVSEPDAGAGVEMADGDLQGCVQYSYVWRSTRGVFQ